MRLQGRSALVTGAVEGIGAEIATRFAAEGARVMLIGRRSEEGERTADRIRKAGGHAFFQSADLTDERAVEHLIDRCTTELGGLDVVVNNAGTAPAGPLSEMTLNAWNEVLANNLTSMFLVTKHAVPVLRMSSHASIINVGSTYSVVGVPGAAAYALTKAGALSLAKSMALELADGGIRVNALCPGATRTELMERWAAESPAGLDATMSASIALHPLGRLGLPEDQAAAALFLASDESSFITGLALFVDGGYTAQ